MSIERLSIRSSSSEENAHTTDNDIVPREFEAFSRSAYFVCFAAALGAFLFGYDTGVVSSALINIGSDLGGKRLTAIEAELVTSAVSVGALFGVLASGNFIDKHGRKLALKASDFGFVIGALLIVFSSTVGQLIFGRLILGVAVGAAAAVTPVYLAELAPTRIRSALICIQSLMITGGQVVSYLCGAILTFSGAWRVLFAVSIIPALLQGVLIHRLPESPRYFLLHHCSADAAQSLRLLYVDASDADIDRKLRDLRDNINQSTTFEMRHSFMERLRIIVSTGRYFRPTFVASMLMLFQQLSGFNTLMYYSAMIFDYAGFHNPPATAILVAFTNFAFTAVCMFAMDRFGKRRMLLLTIPGMILGLLLAAICLHYMTIPTSGKLIEGAKYSSFWANSLVLTTLIFVAFYAMGLGTIPWQCTELIPLEIRGLGTSIQNFFNWFGNILISSTFLTIMDVAGSANTFLLYSLLCFLGLAFSWKCYPELSGRSLEEIHLLFESGFGIKTTTSNRNDGANAQLLL